jgi:hypothetical protein
MMNQWNLFERLVTAIHLTENRGAKVTWNDIINGRQFDVTIRFKHGFYDYLTVVECKSYSGPVPVREVEAFVTKSVDVGANKAIMVSSSGFQKGSIEVAQRHYIELFTLEEISRLQEEDLSASLSPRLNIYGVQLHTKKPPFIVPLLYLSLKRGICCHPLYGTRLSTLGIKPSLSKNCSVPNCP